jgi:hypothetical protein
MIWALTPAPIRRAMAWAVAGLAAVWAIRAGAKREARAETALEAAERYAKTRKAIDHADIPSDDPAILRDWLRSRDPGVK